MSHYTLRALLPSDTERVLGWRNSERVRAAMYTDDLITPAQHEAWLARIATDRTIAVRLAEVDGRPLGIVNFKDIDNRLEGCHWGFYVGAQDAPPGSGSRMGYVAIAEAFATLGVEVIRGEAFAFNQKSIDMHEKLGFQRQETHPEPHMKNGRLEPIVALRLTRDRWNAVQPALEKSLFGALNSHG